MKSALLLSALIFSLVSVAHAQFPEMNDQIDTEAVIEMSTEVQPAWDCDGPPPKTTEWTCFARDARGGSLGVSTSFTRRDLAAGRALASCQRKSNIPKTCAITRCRQPAPPDCSDND
jgi:hypothetical protein